MLASLKWILNKWSLSTSYLGLYVDRDALCTSPYKSPQELPLTRFRLYQGPSLERQARRARVHHRQEGQQGPERPAEWVRRERGEAQFAVGSQACQALFWLDPASPAQPHQGGNPKSSQPVVWTERKWPRCQVGRNSRRGMLQERWMQSRKLTTCSCWFYVS